MTELQDDPVVLLKGDCRKLMPKQVAVDVVIADPPYADTKLRWDKKVEGWLELVRDTLTPCGSLWCFGSMRFFMIHALDFERAGFRYAQDVVWQKHNGSSFQADRFRRIHDHAVQFYPNDVPWEQVYKDPVKTMDATRRVLRRKQGPTHLGDIGGGDYATEDGGPRLMTTIIPVRSCHGYAIHPTQKPEGIIAPLVEYSCPPGGIVGDWFAGSGTAGVVAAKLGRRYIGCESDAGFHGIARERLRALRSDLFSQGVA